MQYDLDAEHLNAGFWAGDDNAPAAGLLRVPGARGRRAARWHRSRPHYAGWVETMGEWMMSYEAVRTCTDPRRAILDFLGSLYALAVDLGGWDAPAHEYTPPAPAPRSVGQTP